MPQEELNEAAEILQKQLSLAEEVYTISPDHEILLNAFPKAIFGLVQLLPFDQYPGLLEKMNQFYSEHPEDQECAESLAGILNFPPYQHGQFIIEALERLLELEKQFPDSEKIVCFASLTQAKMADPYNEKELADIAKAIEARLERFPENWDLCTPPGFCSFEIRRSG